MNTGKWILANALALLLAIPLLASIIFGVLLWQIDSIIFINTAFSLYLAAIVAGAALFAWLQYRIVDKPVTFIRRYLPGLFLLLYLLVVYFIALISAAGETTSQRFIHPYLFWLWPFTLYIFPSLLPGLNSIFHRRGNMAHCYRWLRGWVCSPICWHWHGLLVASRF
ncbi:hypothetical protein ABK737_06995 [Klebsiella aerogenes]|uniref:hypothetical protein n=1 Tax=Klebsiella aerogenes TaxID=548 RepID=UPI000699F399|nr:hypothetical protein [Klebsiella aerogenes]MCT4774244.1 hypothetical protein [Klebsiella aerogenes]MEB7618742.1 hypothetical protein [Klebsiella aerogenes]HBT3294053.1 hypothetical protein [Klebsiella aerogenes]HDT0385844.1 hypothetical protein [Klebsiella aerogenes]HEO9730211.1 hypothetical protein [Klebsiella aerogenes]